MKYIRDFRFFILVFGLIISFILSSCVTAPKLNQPKRSKIQLDNETQLIKTDTSKLSTSQVRKKLNLFKKALKRGKLTKNDWKLHDQLLNAYIDLKQRQSNKVIIPARSRITLPLETYCLNSGRAPPSEKEIYHWQKASPNIRYYTPLLNLRRRGEITQNDLQELVWNLENQTRWGDYPNKLKAILQKIDPQASLKLPSGLKYQATKFVTDNLLGLPGASEALDAYNLLKGHYYKYDDFRKSAESLTSKHRLSNHQNLTQILDTEVYSQSESNGFDNQKVTFYNPNNETQEIDLNEYYLAPERKDVQRVGVNRKPTDDPTLLTDLEKSLFEDMARLGIGFTPLLGDAADLYELFYGKDFISGKSLSFDERLASGVGVVLGSGSAYRHTKRWINSPSKYLLEFEKGIANTAKRSIGSPNYKDTKNIIREGYSKATGLSENLDYKGTKELSDFLKKSSIRRDARVQAVQSFETGTIKRRVLKNDEAVYRWHGGERALPRGRFVSPEKIVDSSNARSLLALPKENKMQHLDTFTLKKGSEVFEGKIAPLEGQPGGGTQILIPGNLDKVLKFKGRIK